MTGWVSALLERLHTLKWWSIVLPWQGAIHVRLGRLKRVLKPGWYLTVPVIDEVWAVNVLRRTTDIGPLPLTTQDKVGVTASALVTWEVADVELFQTTCEDPKEVLHDAASGALAHAVLTHDWDVVPTEPFMAAVCTRVRRQARRYGIRVVGMKYTGIAQCRPLVVWSVGGGHPVLGADVLAKGSE